MFGEKDIKTDYISDEPSEFTKVVTLDDFDGSGLFDEAPEERPGDEDLDVDVEEAIEADEKVIRDSSEIIDDVIELLKELKDSIVDHETKEIEDKEDDEEKEDEEVKEDEENKEDEEESKEEKEELKEELKEEKEESKKKSSLNDKVKILGNLINSFFKFSKTYLNSLKDDQEKNLNFLKSAFKYPLADEDLDNELSKTSSPHNLSVEYILFKNAKSLFNEMIGNIPKNKTAGVNEVMYNLQKFYASAGDSLMDVVSEEAFSKSSDEQLEEYSTEIAKTFVTE